MRDWMDFNDDGIVDDLELMFAEEMLCTSREEHKALFGNDGIFEDNTDDSYDDGYDDIFMNGDYDYDRYDKDIAYADGVDDAIDEYEEEFGEDW